MNKRKGKYYNIYQVFFRNSHDKSHKTKVLAIDERVAKGKAIKKLSEIELNLGNCIKVKILARNILM